jgi:hypothetical protein
MRRFWLAAVALGAIAACGGGDESGSTDSFPADPYTNVASTSGALKVAVRTAPSQPPPRGTCTVELTITDATGAPQDGLDVAVVPFMPSHGHGASVKPNVVAKGGGRYLVSNVSLFMPGSWELRATISGRVNDHATAVVTVP